MAPSLTTFLAAGTLLTAALAAPAADWSSSKNFQQNNRHHGGEKWHRYSVDQVQTLKPQMPTLDGLAPNTNVTLFVPVLGVSNQNYTCNGTEFVQTEAESGATANLFDITSLLMTGEADAATLAQDFKDGRLRGRLGPQIGLHYFSEDNVPVFNLTAAPEEAVLAGAKIGSVDAPDAEMDIPWLFLLDAQNGVSRKLNTVYRVDTHKGVNHRESCREVGKTKSKAYAAQYWLVGIVRNEPFEQEADVLRRFYY